jgi:hypothetical protein
MHGGGRCVEQQRVGRTAAARATRGRKGPGWAGAEFPRKKNQVAEAFCAKFHKGCWNHVLELNQGFRI